MARRGRRTRKEYWHARRAASLEKQLFLPEEIGRILDWNLRISSSAAGRARKGVFRDRKEEYDRIRQEVAEENPDWTRTRVREEALQRFYDFWRSNRSETMIDDWNSFRRMFYPRRRAGFYA